MAKLSMGQGVKGVFSGGGKWGRGGGGVFFKNFETLKTRSNEV